jgi:hypothetical protein
MSREAGNSTFGGAVAHPTHPRQTSPVQIKNRMCGETHLFIRIGQMKMIKLTAIAMTMSEYMIMVKI